MRDTDDIWRLTEELPHERANEAEFSAQVAQFRVFRRV